MLTSVILAPSIKKTPYNVYLANTEVVKGERSRSGWLFHHSLLPPLNSAGHRCASKHCVSAGRREEQICLGRIAKGVLGLVLARGKRGGATVF